MLIVDELGKTILIPDDLRDKGILSEEQSKIARKVLGFEED